MVDIEGWDQGRPAEMIALPGRRRLRYAGWAFQTYRNVDFVDLHSTHHRDQARMYSVYFVDRLLPCFCSSLDSFFSSFPRSAVQLIKSQDYPGLWWWILQTSKHVGKHSCARRQKKRRIKKDCQLSHMCCLVLLWNWGPRRCLRCSQGNSQTNGSWC